MVTKESVLEELLSAPFDIYRNIIVRFIRYYVSRARASKAILGLSGGIDSSLALKLTVEALGNDRVLAVIMPYEGITPQQDIDDAISLAKTLNVEYEYVPLNGVVDKIVALRDGFSDKLVRGNILARLRMLVLYAFANEFGGIVVGTSDKSELLIGYFTKYGDGGSDIMPIGDLYKTQVRKLAEIVGLPGNIVRKPSSPGLWVGQLAEKELGVQYSDIDVVLYLLVEKGYHPRAIKNVSGVNPEVVDKVIELIIKSEHKRKFPRIPKLQHGATVGLDWKYPVWMRF